MKKVIIAILVFSSIFAVSLVSFDRDYSRSSKFNLRKLNDHSIVIGEDYFTNQQVFSETSAALLREAVTALTKKKAWGFEPHIKIAINSGGGYVSFFERLAVADGALLEAYIVCTVSTAASMAFTFMIKYCDERIMLPDAYILQHQVYYQNLFGGRRYDDNTRRIALRHSDLEAKVLDIDRDKWFDISRENGDKVFTKDELIKYKIATGFIKEPPKKD